MNTCLYFGKSNRPRSWGNIVSRYKPKTQMGLVRIPHELGYQNAAHNCRLLNMEERCLCSLLDVAAVSQSGIVSWNKDEHRVVHGSQWWWTTEAEVSTEVHPESSKLTIFVTVLVLILYFLPFLWGLFAARPFYSLCWTSHLATFS